MRARRRAAAGAGRRSAPPPLHLADLPRLATIALALTIVALGQSVAIAKALAARSGQVLDINRECLGQGLANVAGSMFSCFVSCGSLNRSVPHLEAGARTPLAGVMAGAAAAGAGGAGASPLLATGCRWRRSTRCCWSSRGR